MRIADIPINETFEIHYIDNLHGLGNDVVVRKSRVINPCAQRRVIVCFVYLRTAGFVAEPSRFEDNQNMR